MSYTSSYSSGTSSSTQVGASLNDQSSSTSLTFASTLESSTPDASDGLAATVGGEAVAIGEDTLTSGTVSGELVDSGAITTADLSASMTAAAESPDDGAFAFGSTFAGVSDGADLVFSYTLDSQQAEVSADGSSTASAASTTELIAYDLQLSEPVYSGSDGETGAPAESGPSEPELAVDGGLDGNFAMIEFEAIAIGEDSFAAADAFALAIEDELSLSSAMIDLAIQ